MSSFTAKIDQIFAFSLNFIMTFTFDLEGHLTKIFLQVGYIKNYISQKADGNSGSAYLAFWDFPFVYVVKDINLFMII